MWASGLRMGTWFCRLLGQKASFRWKVSVSKLNSELNPKQVFYILTYYSNETAKVEEDEEMNISQEILVLDFGDEKNQDFLRSTDPSADFGKGNYSFIFAI